MAQRASAAKDLTVEEFMVLDTRDGKAELVRGELRLTPPPGGRHGIVWANLTSLLVQHLRQGDFGRVFAESCFELVQLPRTVRAPDVAFVRKERLPAGAIDESRLKLAPDFVAEILSPSETAARLDEKLEDYSVSHVPLVWVIDPRRRTVMVIAKDAPVRWLREGDTLDGADVIPRFSSPVSELFAGLD
jgi:Uma2 family endonuclease